MELFVMIGYDGPEGIERRKLHRAAHLANLESLDASGRIRHAGPLRDEHGSPVGSLIMFEAESLADAQALATRDPYVREGIFERYEVFETRVVFPREVSPP